MPESVKPCEQVLTERKLGLDGFAVHTLRVPEAVFEAAEQRGVSRTVVRERLDKIARALTDSYHILGDYDPRVHGSERAYGSELHELLRKKIGDDDLIQTEASYRKGIPVPWGRVGSSRVDIALGEQGKPFASMCLKTLGAVPSAQQERGWFKNMPPIGDSVIPRIYFKLAK